jgi:hypothetical protein
VLPKGNALFEARSVVASCRLPEAHGGGIVVFGGETATSAKGHDGAGNFTNDVVHIECATGIVCVAAAAGGVSPCVRGWSAMAAWEGGGGGSGGSGGGGGAVVFGGLTGDDDAPVRLGDTWLLRMGDAV